MSEKLQEGAEARRRAARERQENAEERARLAEQSGDDLSARLHRGSAKLHARSADAADMLRDLDAAVEGDQLRSAEEDAS